MPACRFWWLHAHWHAQCPALQAYTPECVVPNDASRSFAGAAAISARCCSASTAPARAAASPVARAEGVKETSQKASRMSETQWVKQLSCCLGTVCAGFAEANQHQQGKNTGAHDESCAKCAPKPPGAEEGARGAWPVRARPALRGSARTSWACQQRCRRVPLHRSRGSAAACACLLFG